MDKLLKVGDKNTNPIIKKNFFLSLISKEYLFYIIGSIKHMCKWIILMIS